MSKPSRFNDVFEQSLYTYMPYQIRKLKEPNQNENAGDPGNGHNQKQGLVGRLRPVVEMIAFSEISIGSLMIIFLLILAFDYDKMYATENTRLISLMSCCGLVLLVVNGILLLASVRMDNRKFLGFTVDITYLQVPEPTQCVSYLLISTLLWVYIFVLSIMKIHFALMVIETDASKSILPDKRNFLLSNACVLGVVTLLGSVVHFIGNVCVFTYYNLKYVQPILVNSEP